MTKIKEYNVAALHIISQIYQDIYIDAAAGYQMVENETSTTMRGFFTYRRQQSYTKLPSKILNGITAAIIFNQISMIQLYEAGVLDQKDGIRGIRRIVLDTLHINCKKIIGEGSDADFSFTGTRHRNAKGRDTFSAKLLLSQGAFEVTGSGLIFLRDCHTITSPDVSL